jgi:hypothetical protein
MKLKDINGLKKRQLNANWRYNMKQQKKKIIKEKLELVSYEEYEEYRRKHEIVCKILKKDTTKEENLKDLDWLLGN